MVLTRKDPFWNAKVTIDKKEMYIPFAILPGSSQFKFFINHNIDLNKYYDKIQVRKGSVVKLSENYNDYFYGFDENDMDEILGTTQIVEEVYEDGSILFENPNEIECLSYCVFGLTEIVETIKY